MLPFAWKRFMHLLYDGCVRARQADLEATHGRKADQKNLISSSWLR